MLYVIGIAPECALAVGGRGQDTPLALGEVLRVRVNVVGTRLFTWLSFHLASAPPADKSCSIHVWRLSPNDKTIRWTSYWDGNAPVCNLVARTSVHSSNISLSRGNGVNNNADHYISNLLRSYFLFPLINPGRNLKSNFFDLVDRVVCYRQGSVT